MTDTKPESELLSIIHNGQTFREGDLVSFKPVDHINTDWVTATLVRGEYGLASDASWEVHDYFKPNLLDLSGALLFGIKKIIRIVTNCTPLAAEGSRVTNGYSGSQYVFHNGSWELQGYGDTEGFRGSDYRVDFDATRDSEPEPAEEEPRMMGELQLADLEAMAVGTVVRDSDGDLWTLGRDGWSNSEFNINLGEYDFAPYNLVSGGPIEGFVKAGTELKPGNRHFVGWTGCAAPKEVVQ